MDQEIVKKIINISGMTCISCEKRIEDCLRKLDGIIEITANFFNADATVTYDENLIQAYEIIQAIEDIGYKAKVKTTESTNLNNNKSQTLIVIVILIFSIYLVINSIRFDFIPQIHQSMSLGILFFVGLLTSLHCVVMCGGLNLSQCVKHNLSENSSLGSKLMPSFLYNLGRVISYSFLGGIVGALGSVFNFSGITKGILALVSGIFMMVIGLNILGIFPLLRKLSPRIPGISKLRSYISSIKHGSLYIGILNGIMPCGSLQAMQIYALGTGNFISGVISMFVFSLGTVPLMFGLGALSAFINNKFKIRMIKASSILVIVLSIIMINRSLNLFGISFFTEPLSNSGYIAKLVGNEQIVTTKLKADSYTQFIVEKGVPLKWIIIAGRNELNECNSTITIPQYNISKKLTVGDNIIEFTPNHTGDLVYTCWMGMIKSSIMIVDNLNSINLDEIKKKVEEDRKAKLDKSCCKPSKTN